MSNKIKKLYFTNDFSSENVKKLEGDGWILRNANLAKSDSFTERADEYGGNIPDRYKGKEITATVVTELSLELQQVIDDAKAECENIQAENADLISGLKTALDAKDQIQAKLTETESQLGALQTENTELKAKIVELEKASAKKPTAAEQKAAKAAEDAKAVEEAKATDQPQG